MSVVDPAHLEERTAWPEAANNNEKTNQDTDGDHCDAGNHYIPANIQHNKNTYCMIVGVVHCAWVRLPYKADFVLVCYWLQTD